MLSEVEQKGLRDVLAGQIKLVADVISVAAFDLDQALPQIDAIRESLLAAHAALLKYIKDLEGNSP